MCAAPRQVLAGGESWVAGSRRQHHHIAGLEVKRFSPFGAEANLGMAARDPEHFVSARVIVHVIVNAVAPGIAPAVARKQLFEYRRWIKVVREADWAAGEDQRQFRIVGNDSVVFEAERIRLAAPDRVTKIPA